MLLLQLVYVRVNKINFMCIICIICIVCLEKKVCGCVCVFKKHVQCNTIFGIPRITHVS